MIEYFPNVYWANLMFCNAVQCGASVGDVDDACRPARTVLKGGKAATSSEFRKALIDGYVHVAERLEKLSAQDESAGRVVSAGEKQLRATALYTTAEMQMDDYLDPAKAAMFEKARASFRKTLRQAGPPHDRAQFVSIPFEGIQLEGLFVPASTNSRSTPVIVHMNGGHSTMDWPYLTGMTGALASRGIASLTFDHPGSGAARYRNGQKYRVEAEGYAGAALDFLEKRSDVDRSRIGICGASLGGYHAPRAAAFDKRIKACLVLGAYYEPALASYFGDLPPLFAKTDGKESAALAERAESLKQARWRWGVETNEALYEKLKRFSLNGVMDKIRVPLLIVHGQNDVQIPLLNAERMIREAANSPNAELVVLGPGEGDQHCSVDNMPLAIELLADWAAEVLLGKSQRSA